MKTKIAAVMLAVGLAMAWGSPSRAQGMPPEAAQVARDFLFAFSRNDRDAIKRMLPNQKANLYGPCPFAHMPQLDKQRADGRIGAIEFAGPMTDPNLPARGIMVLRYVEEGASKSWRVRQLYWFNELPPEAQVPDRSPTKADRRQEPAVRQAAFDFLHAWLRSDWGGMKALTFHWWNVPRRPPHWVKMTRLEVAGRPTTLNGIRVDFDATLRFAGLLRKHVSGNLWLVKEEGSWRVRPITFSLLF